MPSEVSTTLSNKTHKVNNNNHFRTLEHFEEFQRVSMIETTQSPQGYQSDSDYFFFHQQDGKYTKSE
jgi:hypothetical protein